MITSSSNPQIKNLIKLNSKSRARKEQGVFLVEGDRMFGEIPDERIVRVFFSESYYNKKERDLQSAAYPFEILSDSLFKNVSDTVTPQGVLCVVSRLEAKLEELLAADKPSFLLLEDLQDPGNLGTIIRTAEAAGVTGVIMSGNTVDIYSPKTIRSTMGAIFRVPFFYTEDLKETVKQLQEQDVKVYAASLDESTDYDKLSYIEGTAFLIGNEGNGLSAELSKCADAHLKIPMQGHVESLNAAVAAAILTYEVSRQRRNAESTRLDR